MGLSKELLSRSKHNPYLAEFAVSEVERGNYNDIKRFNKLSESVKSQKTPLDRILVSKKRFNKKSLLSVIYNLIVGEDNSSQKEVSKKFVSELEDLYNDYEVVDIDRLIVDISKIESARPFIDHYTYAQIFEVADYIESKVSEICLTLFIKNVSKILQKLITPFIKSCALVFHQSPARIFLFEFIDINNSHPYRKLFPALNYQFSNYNILSKYRDEKRISKYYVFTQRFEK